MQVIIMFVLLVDGTSVCTLICVGGKLVVCIGGSVCGQVHAWICVWLWKGAFRCVWVIAYVGWVYAWTCVWLWKGAFRCVWVIAYVGWVHAWMYVCLLGLFGDAHMWAVWMCVDICACRRVYFGVFGCILSVLVGVWVVYVYVH